VPAFMVHHRSNFVDNEHCVCVTMNFLSMFVLCFWSELIMCGIL
jgi:hypothetical protein